jgi:hypothetical protein
VHRRDLTVIASSLVRGAVGRFTEAELDGLPDPVQRYLRTGIAPGTPLAGTAGIRMKGRIKIGRWVPFVARELLTPQLGFIWAARAAGIISGSDRYVDGRGEMSWKLAGLLRVMHADGPDISRSAAGRAAAEAIWVPTALLPRFDVEWAADDDTHISARYHIEDEPIQVHYQLTPAGHIQSVVFDRWGDPDNTGTFSLHPMGGEFTGHETFDGVTVPDAGKLGWHYGTDRWNEGEFFRYRITDLTLVTDPRTSSTASLS